MDKRILGNGEFVHRVIKESEGKSLRQIKLKRSGLTQIKIVDQEGEKGQISRTELQNGSRRQR